MEKYIKSFNYSNNKTYKILEIYDECKPLYGNMRELNDILGVKRSNINKSKYFEEIMGQYDVKNEDDFKTPNSEDVDKEKKRKKQRRLSFADEHGQDLKEVSYHSNLHYSPGESDNDSPKGDSGGCCIIS